jgi:hypothetical protein
MLEIDKSLEREFSLVENSGGDQYAALFLLNFPPGRNI